jgi:hypothetical protein
MQRAKRLVWSGSHGLAREFFLRKIDNWHNVEQASMRLLQQMANKNLHGMLYQSCPRCGMVTTGARMYFCQKFNTVFLLNALH